MIEQLMALLGGGQMPQQGGQGPAALLRALQQMQGGGGPAGGEMPPMEAADAVPHGGRSKMNAMAQEGASDDFPDGMMPMGQADVAGPARAAMSDQAMLDQVHSKMGEEVSDLPWEGEQDGVPTQRDLLMLNKSPTDGVINDFIKHFPTWYDQNIQAEGGKGMSEGGKYEGDYALSEEEKEEAYEGRETEIDKR